jgi:hypothetical protein
VSQSDGSIKVIWLCGSGEDCINGETPGRHNGDDWKDAEECVRLRKERMAHDADAD